MLLKRQTGETLTHSALQCVDMLFLKTADNVQHPAMTTNSVKVKLVDTDVTKTKL